MKPGLSLIGSGADSCTVDARPLNVLYAITVADSCLLKGFKIIASNIENMRCINVSAINSDVTLNRITTAAEGIYNSNSNPTIYNNIIDNIVYRGISIYNSNCYIIKNYILMNTENPSEADLPPKNGSNC